MTPNKKKFSLRRTWHVGYPWLGGTVIGLAGWYFGAQSRVFQSEAIETAVLGGVIAFAGLILSVLLALMGLLVALDGRPIIQEIRRRDLYRDLLMLAFQPIMVFMALALLAVFGLLTKSTDRYAVRQVVAIGTLVAMSSGLLGTLRFAIQLMGIVSEQSDTSETDDEKPELDAARRRAAEEAAASESTQFRALQPVGPR